MKRRVVTFVSRLDPSRWGWLTAGCIAFLCVMGSVAASGGGGGAWLSAFALDGEKNVPTAFSAGLLVAAAAMTLVLRAAGGAYRPRAGAALGLAAFFAWMAVDEAGQVHERLERILTVDWETLYVPVVAVGAVAWLAVLASLWRHRTGRLLFVCGAAAWVIAQVLERFEYDARDLRVADFAPLSVAEETLEMAGSALWVFALLVVLRAALAPEDTEVLRPERALSRR